MTLSGAWFIAPRARTVGLAVDAGLRISFKTRQPWLRPYVGGHHMWLLGYDATVRRSYDGFSGVVGVEVGGF